MTRKGFALLLALAFAASAAGQIPGSDIDGPFARVKRNDDGSVTVFERGNDLRSLTKTTKSPQGQILVLTQYRLDGRGNPLKCDIFDQNGTRIFKTQFGYSKRPGPTFGKLVQELLYDARNKNIDPETGKEKPVHMFLYTYNADGSPNLPVGVTLVAGRTAEEVFGG